MQTCQDHFQQERERERADPAGLRRSEMYFLGDVGPSAPFQVRNGKEEASGNINLPTGREAPNLSDCMKTRTSTVHHLLAPAAAILTVPPSLKSFKDTSGREGGEHTESRGGKGKRLAQLGNRSGVTGKAAAPLQSSGAYLGSFPSGTRREGVRFRASPGHRDEGTLGPPPQPAGGTADAGPDPRSCPPGASSMAESSRSSPEPSVLLTPPPITMAELARPPPSSSSSSSSSSGIMESAAVSPEGLAGLACSSGLCRGHVQERGRLCGSNSGSSSTSSGESGTGEAGASAIFAACPPPAAWALALSSRAQAGCGGGGTGHREGSSSSYLGKREERVGYPVLEPSPRRLLARGRHLERIDLGTCVPRTWRSRRRPLAWPPGRRERIDGPARGSPLPRCRRQNRRSLPD